MIITEPAAVIISQTFAQSVASIARFRLKGRERRAVNTFSSQAYADAGMLPAANPAVAATAAQPSAIQRRETPLR
jgi:hypothetical protein